MFIHVVTGWPCWQRVVAPCDGAMIVQGEDNFHSIVCKKCGFGAAGKNPLPEAYIAKLIEDGYIRQISRRPAEAANLTRFFADRVKRGRTPAELAGDLLEIYEVFVR